jgi:CRISPR-associated protein Cmr6
MTDTSLTAKHPLLPGVLALIDANKASIVNPGLMLDKFTTPGKQEESKNEIQAVIEATGKAKDAAEKAKKEFGNVFNQALDQRKTMLDALGAQRFSATTNSPLSLHLARASALENAGIALHPTYGFAYIPGSGLKGMAHAYACEVWLPGQAWLIDQNKEVDADEQCVEKAVQLSDKERETAKKALWERIIDVFGAAPSPWFDNPNWENQKNGCPGLIQKIEKELHIDLLPKDTKERKQQIAKWNRVGSVVFHDAWPTQWPKLICDIVNNHHKEYYGQKGERPVYYFDDTGNLIVDAKGAYVLDRNDTRIQRKKAVFAPGDWEDPNPVYFLAVAPGGTFEFPLTLLKKKTPNETHEPSDFDLATQWILGALIHFGAGAKTHAGYGRMRLEETPMDFPELDERVARDWAAACQAGRFKECNFTLELVSPAFLARSEQACERKSEQDFKDKYDTGAKGKDKRPILGDVTGFVFEQPDDDCVLETSTVLGLLRWWWRTLYSGFINADLFHKLESAIWGNADIGGCIQCHLQPDLNSQKTDLCGFKNLIGGSDAKKASFKVNEVFISGHGISKESRDKTTQGILYLSFGMDDFKEVKITESGVAKKQRNRHRRRYMLPGAKWCLHATARKCEFVLDKKLTITMKPQEILDQFHAAIYLLCSFGGIGAKSRNGFGSLSIPKELNGWNLEKCKETAKNLLTSLGFGSKWNESQAHSPSLENLFDVRLPLLTEDVFRALDMLGSAYQAFAKKQAHNREKRALGLPRKKDRFMQGHFNPTGPLTGLGECEKLRHPSPFFFRLSKKNKEFVIDATFFPSPYFPDLVSSKEMLEGLKNHLSNELGVIVSSTPPSSSAPTAGMQKSQEHTLTLLKENEKWFGINDNVPDGWTNRVEIIQGIDMLSPNSQEPKKAVVLILEGTKKRNAFGRIVKLC